MEGCAVLISTHKVAWVILNNMGYFIHPSEKKSLFPLLTVVFYLFTYQNKCIYLREKRMIGG